MTTKITKKRNKLDWQEIGMWISLICVVFVVVGMTLIPIVGITICSIIAAGGWVGINMDIGLIALTLSLCSIFLIVVTIIDYKIIKENVLI